MSPLPVSVNVLFLIISVLALWLFYYASGRSKSLLYVMIAWMVLQAFISSSGFYTKTDTLPPRFIFLIGPALLIIIVVFLTKNGRSFIDGFSLKTLTWLHVLRIPVELGLYLLYIHHFIPEIMTFEGLNFDVISGISAPVMVYFCFIRKTAGRHVLLIWNIICFILLFNIIILSILAAPTPLQQIAFDQPNRGVFYFTGI